MIQPIQPGGRFNAINVSLQQLLRIAYGLLARTGGRLGAQLRPSTTDCTASWQPREGTPLSQLYSVRSATIGSISSARRAGT